MRFITLVKILPILILTILFFTLTKKLYAQDTLCYKEIYRYKYSKKGYYGDRIIANYKKKWLYELKTPTYTDSCTIFLYKEYDTLYKTFKYHKYQFRLGITKNGNCFLASYLNDRENKDGTCIISVLDSNLVVIDSFNIKTQDYNFELYTSLTYLQRRKDTIIIKDSHYGGGGFSFFTEKELIMKSYRPLCPYLYDFEYDSIIYFGSYQEQDKVDIVNNGIEYVKSKNYMKEFNSIEDIFGNKEPFLVSFYTTFIENGIVTQLKNGDIVFYQFCENIEDE